MRKVKAGTHILGSLQGCPFELLDRSEVVVDILRKVIDESGLTPVGESFHQFEPYGVTGVIILSESHLSIHTWPENNFAAVDVFTCGDAKKAEVAFDVLCRLLKVGSFNKQVIVR